MGSGRRNNKSPALIHSISTANAYRSALTTFCRWIQNNRLGNLIQVNVKTCSSFLEERAGQVGQKTLDRDRQAIQYLLGRTTKMKILLPRIKSTYFIPSARRTPTVALSPHSADGFKITGSGISYRSMSRPAPVSLRNGQGSWKSRAKSSRVFCWQVVGQKIEDKIPGPRPPGYSIPARQNNQNENSAATDQVYLLGWTTPRKTVSSVYKGPG